MGIYKKMKFPFEVTKGKAEDLYRLRFMRKSELEPSMRHNVRHSVCQMDHQLDLWFKEQLFTIGSLNKEKEKLHKSRKRLKTEIRRSKKREYARHQEEIRTKLKDIKMRMLMMKVIQKFKENVTIARSYRSGESNLKGNVDVLRVAGNKQLIHDYEEKQKQAILDIERAEKENQHDPENKERSTRKDTSGENDEVNYPNKETSVLKDTLEKYEPRSRTNLAKSGEINDMDEFGETPIASSDDEGDDNDVDGDGDYSEDGVLGQRYPSSHGPRMETIPEETEEVEVEMNDDRSFPKLTKRRLNLLNRSQSKRNIFDVNDSVPLLPDVTSHHVQMQTNEKVRHLPDTVDKETQTSDKSKSDTSKRKKQSHLRKSANSSERNVKRTIVVKLPRSQIPTNRERNDSAKSNSGHFGSEDSDEDYNDETTDTDFAYGFESDLITSETEDYVDQSEDGNDADVETESSFGNTIQDDLSFSLTKYKTTLRRKAENSPTSQSLPSVTNIEANFPNITAFSIQNPFSVRYKERSFVLKTINNERATGSAKLARKSREMFTDDSHLIHTPKQVNRDKTKEMKHQRSEEIRKLLMAENHKNKQETPNTPIAIYGKKPDGVSGKHFPSPATSPVPNRSHQGLSPRRSSTIAHQKHVLYTHTRARTEEQERIHNIVKCEPVQKYERTRSGKIRPFGTPRMPNNEIPSLRDQYYRDKLLKAERDSMLKQNMKMKKFIDTFDKGGDLTKLPTVSGGALAGVETNATTSSHDRPKKSLGNILFKVYQPEQNVEIERKVVPGVSTTSLRLLKNCRYLREYKPMTEQDKEELHSEKKTSWDMVKTKSEYSNGYLANVRVNLI